MKAIDRFKSWLAGDTIASAVRSITVQHVAGNDGVWTGEHVTASSALSLPSVWACVNLIAGSIASLPVQVYRDRPDGEREVNKGHNLYRLLHDRPNYDQTALDFWEFMAASLELWGNAYAVIERSDDRITSLVPVNPALMAVRRLPNGSIEYRWSEDGKDNRHTDATMFHIRGFGGNPLGGMSTLHFGRQAFGLAQAAGRSASTTFANGMRPSGVLKFTDWLKPDQRDLAENVMAQKLAGAANAGRLMVLEGGVEFSPLTMKPEDAQMLETQRYTVEEVCRFFGVPPHMVGHTEKSTSWGSGIEQQTLGFVKFTLRRRVKRIEQAIMQQLLTDRDRSRGLSVEFNFEGLLRGDSAGRASFYQTMTSIGAMTINEVRALENLPRVDGGDVPRMQMQNVPITEADQQTEED